ncbi:hypothetical protein [Streptomyces sp. JHA26]|uniref:hypothetical protein n=1 Tax=Streptomyces sp. JHA26 TaxID=1917143 RepID=UPI00209B9BC8|nr:hypothetical protein [Streptomyces sp. JHA26]
MRELCRRLGEYRDRPISLVPFPLPVPGPFGLWVATGTADYIFYQQETSPSHQDHIILHEISHILADHPGGEAEGGVWQAAVPDIHQDVITRMLRRSGYGEESEREAELVATIILEWASVLNQVTPRDSQDPSLGPLRNALHSRWGWM